MTLPLVLLISGGVFAGGILAGYLLRFVLVALKQGSLDLRLKKRELQAEEEANRVVEAAQAKALTIAQDLREKERDLNAQIKKKEERLEKKEELLDKRQADMNEEMDGVRRRIDEVRTLKDRVLAAEDQKGRELERISHMTIDEARDALVARMEHECEEDVLARLRKMEHTGIERLESRAREILTTAIHRLGNSVASEVMATSVAIPNEDIKGKIIGKEGRNIRAFERASGVELIIDDTPGVVTISCFDPVRRQIARAALETLMGDGRIQPSRIEEVVEKARRDIHKIIKEKGSQATYECGVLHMDPQLVAILGRLHFRTSYGQNVLQHSIEMAHIAGMIAQELGADVAIAKAGALLHDIGKTVSQEVQGTHVEIGRRMLKKFGVDERVILAMQSHHEEYPYETIESVIVQVADAISGGRPGARRDTVEHYIKRLEDLEGIAAGFEGVEKVYAIAAGREIRVFVTPEKVSDLEARHMARNIALKVEHELQYPGEIKIAVIRESRVVEYAR